MTRTLHSLQVNEIRQYLLARKQNIKNLNNLPPSSNASLLHVLKDYS